MSDSYSRTETHFMFVLIWQHLDMPVLFKMWWNNAMEKHLEPGDGEKGKVIGY